MVFKTSMSLLLLAGCGLCFAFQDLRSATPLVIDGSDLAALQGAPIDELRLYRLQGNLWSPVLFQMDERNPDGSFFLPDDQVLDANDQLALQPQDAGELASTLQWPDDAEAQSHARIEIQIEDPVESAFRYVYLFRSSTLPFSSAPNYVTYDSVSDTLTGITYQVGFDSTGAVLSDLRTREGGTFSPDLLDREKLRISGSAIITTFSLDEDDLTVLGVQGVVGPIRLLRRVDAEVSLLGNTLPLALERHFYGRFFEIPSASGNVELPFGVSLTNIRISRDFNAMASGATLRDPNNSNLAIEGMPDPGVVTAITLSQQNAYWQEVSIDSFSMWNLMAFQGLAGNSLFYYRDNSAGGTADGTADTGDLISFGDHGVWFQNPDANAIQFSFGTQIEQNSQLTPSKAEAYIQTPFSLEISTASFTNQFWNFIALWGSDQPSAPVVPFLITFINNFGVPPL